jgi:hypothetical protein
MLRYQGTTVLVATANDASTFYKSVPGSAPYGDTGYYTFVRLNCVQPEAYYSFLTLQLPALHASSRRRLELRKEIVVDTNVLLQSGSGLFRLSFVCGSVGVTEYRLR